MKILFWFLVSYSPIIYIEASNLPVCDFNISNWWYGIGIYLIESPHEDAQITNLIDAFWWASATVTTVGYGDVVPVTELGRLMGIGLMFVGISIIGTFISALGAMLIGSRLKKHETVEDFTKSMIIKKINDIENLEKNEVELLISMVKDLHDEVKSNRKKHK